jgi:hypothetical protein
MTVNKLNLFTRRLVNLITFVECSRRVRFWSARLLIMWVQISSWDDCMSAFSVLYCPVYVVKAMGQSPIERVLPNVYMI